MSKFNREKFIEDGFLVLDNFYDIEECHLQTANEIMSDYNYKIGRRHVCNNPSKFNNNLREVVLDDRIYNFFNSLEERENILCRDIMLTNEFKHDIMERNKWLHFDRWRSYKAMVYLSDVTTSDGPFSVVRGSHKKGAELRRSFSHMRYENRPNRIELDYPELYQEPLKLIGTSGTLILFDSDIFHLGGKIEKDHERTLIRSHWYSTKNWRENS